MDTKEQDCDEPATLSTPRVQPPPLPQPPLRAHLRKNMRALGFESDRYKRRARERSKMQSEQFKNSGSCQAPCSADNDSANAIQLSDVSATVIPSGDAQSDIETRHTRDRQKLSEDDQPLGLVNSCNTCFICFRLRSQDYAVRVKVAWPHRQEMTRQRVTESGRVRFNIVEVAQGTAEEVMQAMNDALYTHVGSWKKWLWCFEIKTAEEVEFWFDDVLCNDRILINVIRLDSHTIETAAQTVIDSGPSEGV
ncbi:hypothetical protein AMS68_000231 [Peltaster fructicola]|uniref:Uncharacterized protein n=1 Tax=Peltaster fructicola TaxID=286661 RepID=A0A6H0XJ23_9PEZI|nr:hypothetical protein AMS68_000231 [Peltaster fructicola]